MRNKLFYQPFVVIRSKFNPLRYILGKEKVIWAPTLSDYYANQIELDVSKIKLISKESEEV